MGAHYRFFYKLSLVLARSLFRFEVVHRERILETGGAIIAANHESYLDPPLCGIACRREIYYLARKTLLDWPVLGPILPKLNVIPVDQERADMSAIKTVIKLVRTGNCALVFPEGSRTLDGELQAAQPGVGMIVAKTLVPVIPMRIFGARAAFPRGGKPRLFQPVTLVVGEPFSLTPGDVAGGGREVYQKVSDLIMSRIAAISYERP